MYTIGAANRVFGIVARGRGMYTIGAANRAFGIVARGVACTPLEQPIGCLGKLPGAWHVYHWSSQ